MVDEDQSKKLELKKVRTEKGKDQGKDNDEETFLRCFGHTIRDRPDAAVCGITKR
jgi:hypothetical protein